MLISNLGVATNMSVKHHLLLLSRRLLLRLFFASSSSAFFLALFSLLVIALELLDDMGHLHFPAAALKCARAIMRFKQPTYVSVVLFCHILSRGLGTGLRRGRGLRRSDEDEGSDKDEVFEEDPKEEIEDDASEERQGAGGSRENNIQ
jgi:hypothetical protein